MSALALLLLACAARAPAPPPAAARPSALLPHRLSVGTIATFPGKVTDRVDWGLEGSLTVETDGAAQVQQLNWAVVGTSDRDRAGIVWRLMRDLLAKGAPTTLAEEPTLGTAIVAGQSASTWEMEIGAEAIHFSGWTCPGAGASVWLVTGGPAVWVRGAHAASVATATCATTPVALDPRAIVWEPTGGPEWVLQPAEGPDRAAWKRDDGKVLASVFVAEPVVPENGLDPCGTMMDGIVREIRATYAIPADGVRARDAGLCSRSFEGALGEMPVRGVFTQYVCDAQRGYVTFCLLMDPAAPVDTCDAVVRCRE
ncbi:MAG: hypothetical protein ACK4YP_24105 [Myxococcota bacterium]